MGYRSMKRKLTMEHILMWPFVLIGKIAGHIFTLDTKHNLFLFYPNGDIGGSPQVNIDILHCMQDVQPLIIFSKNANNNAFSNQYDVAGARVINLAPYIDKKWLHFINLFFRGLISTWINKAENPVVFGGESLFFYKMLRHINPEVKSVELCHLSTWLPYSIGFADEIDVRTFSTKKLKEAVEAQYRNDNLPQTYFDKLHFYDNAIDIPPLVQNNKSILDVYFIGRGAPQKRVHLIAAIAQKLHDDNVAVKVNFVGDVDKVIDPATLPFCNFYGNVNDQAKMHAHYVQADVLLLTSAFEGLPIVVMQMMAYGKVVVSTAVDGIPDYIIDGENGLLIHETTEAEIIQAGFLKIRQLATDHALRNRLGLNSRALASKTFSKQNFCNTYRNLLLAPRL